jgi:hypothetical protein
VATVTVTCDFTHPSRRDKPEDGGAEAAVQAPDAIRPHDRHRRRLRPLQPGALCINAPVLCASMPRWCTAFEWSICCGFCCRQPCCRRRCLCTCAACIRPPAGAGRPLSAPPSVQTARVQSRHHRKVQVLQQLGTHPQAPRRVCDGHLLRLHHRQRVQHRGHALQRLRAAVRTCALPGPMCASRCKDTCQLARAVFAALVPDAETVRIGKRLTENSPAPTHKNFDLSSLQWHSAPFANAVSHIHRSCGLGCYHPTMLCRNHYYAWTKHPAAS